MIITIYKTITIHRMFLIKSPFIFGQCLAIKEPNGKRLTREAVNFVYLSLTMLFKLGHQKLKDIMLVIQQILLYFHQNKIEFYCMLVDGGSNDGGFIIAPPEPRLTLCFYRSIRQLLAFLAIAASELFWPKFRCSLIYRPYRR